MLQVHDLVKSFDRSHRRMQRADNSSARGMALAVDGVSFRVNEGDFFTLLGPSGCGKTTTLRSIAGLERPDAGTISLRDEVLYSGADGTDVPANKRNLSMVFQSYAIWPHMDVFSNVAFPLRIRRGARRLKTSAIEARVKRVLEVTELLPMLRRPATQLSGGQQQRLALARALVTEPELVLLDEPLSNLDATLRESMRLELKRLQEELGLTAVYVTHDQAEALALSTTIVVMNQGKIVQVGTPTEIYSHPESRFVAEFIGTSNVLPGVVVSGGSESRIRTPVGELRARSSKNTTAGNDVVASVRPEDIIMETTREDRADVNCLRATVRTRVFLGDAMDHVLDVGGYELRCRSSSALSKTPGDEVYLTIPPNRVRVLPAGS